VAVAAERLGPLGVQVVGVPPGEQERSALPLEDASFELVINRHEAFESAEVYRILEPGGLFVTQQVGDRDLENLRIIMGTLESDVDFAWSMATCTAFLQQAGFTIVEAREHVGYSRFYDIRALVYLVKALPWVFPTFDAQRHHDQLLNIYYKIWRDGYLDTNRHRFFVIARKG
jgi:SAM-dependent methyltransferase